MLLAELVPVILEVTPELLVLMAEVVVTLLLPEPAVTPELQVLPLLDLSVLAEAVVLLILLVLELELEVTPEIQVQPLPAFLGPNWHCMILLNKIAGLRILVKSFEWIRMLAAILVALRGSILGAGKMGRPNSLGTIPNHCWSPFENSIGLEILLLEEWSYPNNVATKQKQNYK